MPGRDLAVELGHGVDEEPFDKFYESEYPRLVAAIALVIDDVDLARDSVDEALARAWEQTQKGQKIECLGAWVRVVALNVARGRFRRRATERRFQSRVVHLDLVAAEDGGLGIDVRRALARLPRRQREVTVMHYFLDLSVLDIARELKVAEGTVKTSLHRARLALSGTLSDHSPNGEVSRGA